MVKKITEVNNFLIPEHRKLTEDEVKEVLEKHNLVDTSKLPRIKKGDPALAVIEAEFGDVIEITRTKGFAGTSKYYRVVVE